MRLGLSSAFGALVLAFGFGCGSGGTGGDDTSAGPDANDLPPPDQGFQIRSPDIQLEAGQEITYCYYTTLTEVTAATGIKQWSSEMTPGSHHLIVFFTDSAEQPDGTLTANCGFAGGNGTNLPIWSYSSQQETQTMDMPAGVGMQGKAGQHLFVQMHYPDTDPNNAKTVHVTINGTTYAPTEQYTPASAFVTYSTDIHIAGGVGMTASNEHTCPVPAGKTWFALSTHSHRRSVHTEVHDGSTMIFQSDNWEHPGGTDWLADPHYQFAGDLTYHCDYVNDLDQDVNTGDSAATDEMCMAVGYYYPASTATFCINGFEL